MAAIPKYLTVGELIERLGDEAEQLAGSGLRGDRVVDGQLLAGQLVHADTIIDGYIRARYPRPFALVPDLLKGIAFDIVRWRLRAAGGQQTAMIDTVRAQYDESMRLLRDLQAGKALLDVSDGLDPDDARAVAESVSGHMPPARMGNILKGWL